MHYTIGLLNMKCQFIPHIFLKKHTGEINIFNHLFSLCFNPLLLIVNKPITEFVCFLVKISKL